MRESTVWQYLSSRCEHGVHLERLEVKFPPGLSDCLFEDQRTGKVGFLELKYCEPTDTAYRAGRIPKIRPEQPLFLNRRARHGTPGGILLRVGQRGPWLLWAASGDPEWVRQVQGNLALSCCDERFENPTAGAVVAALQSAFAEKTWRP